MLKTSQLVTYQNFAEECARAAGQFIIENKTKTLDIDFKGRANLVTQIDRHSEEIIVTRIQAQYPDHQILTEETPPVESNSAFKWIIDPLDGTTNYVHGFPFYAVSIGLEYDGEIVMGVVFIPETYELFSAQKGKGARLNGNPIQVSNTADLQYSLLATGFPYELLDHFYENMSFFKSFYERSQSVRRAGAAAIDLCYTACGRFDGFWEMDLKPWDTAAGIVIVREAGGTVTDFQGNDFSIYGNKVVASNSLIHPQMLGILQSASAP